jgi:hypothetical protein
VQTCCQVCRRNLQAFSCELHSGIVKHLFEFLHSA